MEASETIRSFLLFRQRCLLLGVAVSQAVTLRHASRSQLTQETDTADMLTTLMDGIPHLVTASYPTVRDVGQLMQAQASTSGGALN